MAKRFFETAKHTALYAKFRFPVTDVVISPIVSYLSKNLSPPHDVVLDAGCGTGQAAEVLCKHFKNYIGVDISEGQIAQANASLTKPSNAEFVLGPCEHFPFVEDNSVDLISASQSYHWFEHSKFCNEVRRILKPGGVLAVYAYTRLEITSDAITPEQNLLIEKARKRCYDIFDEHWDSAREYIRQEYRNVELPYQDVDRLTVRDHFEKDFAFLKNFFLTLSPYRNILNKDPKMAEDIFTNLEKDFKEAFGSHWKGDETPLNISRPFCVVLCKKPKE